MNKETPKEFTFRARQINTQRLRNKNGELEVRMTFYIDPDEMKDRLSDMIDMLNVTHVRDPKILEDILAPLEIGQKHKIDKFHCAAKKKITGVKFNGDEIPGFNFIDSLILKITLDKESNPVYHFKFCAYGGSDKGLVAFDESYFNLKEEVEHPKNPDKVVLKWKYFPITFSMENLISD